MGPRLQSRGATRTVQRSHPEWLDIQVTVKITFEIDDDELRRVIGPLFQFPAAEAPRSITSLLKTHEAAERLGISRSKMHELVASGQIASISIGRSRRISARELEEYIAGARGEVATNGRVRALTPMSNTPNVRTPRPRPERQPPARRPKYSRAAVVAEAKPHATLDQLLEPKPETGGPRETPQQYREHCERVIDGLKTSGWPDDLVKQIEADMHNRVHRVYVLDIKSVQSYLASVDTPWASWSKMARSDSSRLPPSTAIKSPRSASRSSTC
jgi:excisionase family DNA binding protein